MIVLDASVVLEILLASARGLAIAEEVLLSEESLHAPWLLDAEVANAMRRVWLRGELTAQRGQEALQDLTDLPIHRHGHAGLVERAWQLRDSLTAYDAFYIALAETLPATLLTGDARLSRAPGHSARVELR